MRALPRLSCLVIAVLSVATPAAAEGWRCTFASGDASGATEVRLVSEGGAWRFEVEDEAFPAEPVLMPGSTAAHFLVAPVDKAADAVALVSFFEDGKAFLSLHGDFFGGVGETRDGTCTREGG